MKTKFAKLLLPFHTPFRYNEFYITGSKYFLFKDLKIHTCFQTSFIPPLYFEDYNMMIFSTAPSNFFFT